MIRRGNPAGLGFLSTAQAPDRRYLCRVVRRAQSGFERHPIPQAASPKTPDKDYTTDRAAEIQAFEFRVRGEPWNANRRRPGARRSGPVNLRFQSGHQTLVTV